MHFYSLGGDLYRSKQQHDEHLYVIKGKQKISDLISGELSNEILKVPKKESGKFSDTIHILGKSHLKYSNYIIGHT